MKYLSPSLELDLEGPEHLSLRIVPPLGDDDETILVIPDELWKALSRRRVTLRFNEAHIFHEDSLVERVARELREAANGIEPSVDEVLEEICRRRNEGLRP